MHTANTVGVQFPCFAGCLILCKKEIPALMLIQSSAEGNRWQTCLE